MLHSNSPKKSVSVSWHIKNENKCCLALRCDMQYSCVTDSLADLFVAVPLWAFLSSFFCVNLTFNLCATVSAYKWVNHLFFVFFVTYKTCDCHILKTHFVADWWRGPGLGTSSAWRKRSRSLSWSETSRSARSRPTSSKPSSPWVQTSFHKRWHPRRIPAAVLNARI